MATMSPSTFQRRIKAVTAMNPARNPRSLRLTEARQLLLAKKADAKSAAQFSRHCSRMFEARLKRDLKNIANLVTHSV